MSRYIVKDYVFRKAKTTYKFFFGGGGGARILFKLKRSVIASYIYGIPFSCIWPNLSLSTGPLYLYYVNASWITDLFLGVMLWL
jgi:hypothetical protein